ncbi:15249_t:CDS:2, partial [Dentiscutata heterogama]
NDEKYSYHEYVVYHLYHKYFTFNYTNADKNNFVAAYNELKQKYLDSNIKSKLTEDDKVLTNVYYDLLKEIRRDFTKSHTLTLFLIDAIRNFGWIEFDPSENAKMISAIQNIKNISIIDPENIISLKPSLLKSLENLEEWKQINSIDLSVKEITFTQSLSAKGRGVRKFGDVIGYITGSDK